MWLPSDVYIDGPTDLQTDMQTGVHCFIYSVSPAGAEYIHTIL